MHKKNKTFLESHERRLGGTAASMAVIMTVLATHAPGHLPPPPWPPHALHIEVAPVESSPGNVRTPLADGGSSKSVRLTGLSMEAEAG